MDEKCFRVGKAGDDLLNEIPFLLLGFLRDSDREFFCFSRNTTSDSKSIPEH